MRKNNKKCVRNIIIVSVISLTTLMIVLFILLENYLGKQQKSTYIEAQIQSRQIDDSILLSESKTILVDQLGESQIRGYDIKDNQLFNKKIIEEAKVTDAYGKVFPITEIKRGEIVEVSYRGDEDCVISISKSTHAESWKRITGVIVDEASSQIKIGSTSYTYTEETLILDAKGEETEIANLGPFDVASIQCVDQNVWSVIIEEASASIYMIDLPTQDGEIEIDNSRLLQFQDVTEPIKVIPGEHKLIIKMDGYVTISETVNLSPGEAYELSLQDAEIAYATVKPYIGGNVEDYTIKLGSYVYEPDDEIRLPQGEYEVEITAEGYEKWASKVKLKNEFCTLGARLTATNEELEEIE